MTPDTPSARWSVRNAAGITWRQWDSEVAVYTDATGGTHLLDADGGAVLLSLLHLARPAAIGEIAAAAWPDSSNDTQARTAAVLDALQRIGLAEPHAS